MNVQPQIGGVLRGGGEATQYSIVCEHKPLFKVNSLKSGPFSVGYILVAYLQDYNILELPGYKKTANYLAF